MIRFLMILVAATCGALLAGCSTVADSFQAGVNGADVQVMGKDDQVVAGADEDNSVIAQVLVENKSWLTFDTSNPVTGLPSVSLGHKRILFQFIRTGSENNADAHANDSASILAGQAVTLGVGASVSQVEGDPEATRVVATVAQ